MIEKYSFDAYLKLTICNNTKLSARDCLLHSVC